MEIVLEQEEVDRLLRQALKVQGVIVPHGADFVIRRNNKKQTLRVVYMQNEWARREDTLREEP